MFDITWKNIWVHNSNKDIKFDSLSGNALIENIKITHARRRYLYLLNNKVLNKVITVNNCIFENAKGIANGPGIYVN